MSLMGIATITLVCDVILPHGQTEKYVKTVISLIIVCAIVIPLAKVMLNFDTTVLDTDKKFSYQTDYLDYVREEKAQAFSEACDKKLSENGLIGCKTKVSLDEFFAVKSVEVAVERAYYNQAAVEKIASLVTSVVKIDKGEVSCVVKN